MNANLPSFRQVFGNLDTRTFLDSFNHRPIHCVAADTQGRSALLSLEEFYLSLRRCQKVRAIYPPFAARLVKPEECRPHLDAGATICATALDEAVPRLSRLVFDLAKELRYTGQIRINGYHSLPRSGLAYHYDTKIVTAVQLVGTKRWWFCEAPCERLPLERRYTDATREAFVNEFLARNSPIELSLSPGDVLCLPAGCLHGTEALTESLSLNVAFEYGPTVPTLLWDRPLH